MIIWPQPAVAPSRCSAEPAFSAAASFAVCAITDFPFGLRLGIRIGDANISSHMVRNFNP
jgi:hypothetical protein